MAIRTTVADVQAILDTDLTSAQLTAFITDASLWVDTHLAGACTALSTSILTAVEKYLAAHYATARDPRLKSVKLDDTQESYQRDATVSEYLKIAAELDPCGVVRDRLIEGKRSAIWRVGSGYDSTIGDEP